MTSLEYYDVNGRHEPRPPVETPGVHLSPEEEADRCIFCQIIHGRHAHFKVLETAYWYAFLDTRPLSQRHTLVVPKVHYRSLQEVPDNMLMEIGPILARLGAVMGDYNVLSNNGRLAHQFVDHAHFHVIPKPSSKEGLQMTWLAERQTHEDLAVAAQRMTDHL